MFAENPCPFEVELLSAIQGQVVDALHLVVVALVTFEDVRLV